MASNGCPYHTVSEILEANATALRDAATITAMHLKLRHVAEAQRNMANANLKAALDRIEYLEKNVVVPHG